jgi:hypothetical protein
MRATWRNKLRLSSPSGKITATKAFASVLCRLEANERFTKGKPMKKAALLIAILVAVAVLAANEIKVVNGHAAATTQSSFADDVQKPEVTEEFHQTYPLSPAGRVSVSNINGDVHINVWDQNSVKVDAVKRARSQQSLSEVTIDVTNTADSVKVKTRYPENNNYNRRDREDGAASVEYTLTVPRGASLDGAELVNGSLDVEGIQGDVHAALVNGTVKATGLGGEVKLSTVNGGIGADLAALQSAKEVTLNSVNGPIVLVIPGGASADVKASTVHGAITNDFGLAVEDGPYVGHNLSGQIGSGGTRVRLNNVNGPIAIKRAGSVM